ncbi:hypothetical protein [Thermoflexus sp.]|uniref:hypothetical protein n=1 Tax=Thermoflexus sp. TaxID=1969742 RepID=UPI0035E443A5
MGKDESRYGIVAQMAYRLAQQVWPRYSHPKSLHLYTLPQLAACVLFTFYLKLSNGFRNGLRRDARRDACKQGWSIVGDAGFDGRGVTARDGIPFICRGGQRVDPKRRARAEWGDAAGWDGGYDPHGKAETVNSVIQRKFGDALRSRRASLQHREPAIQALVDNLYR